MDLQPLDEQVRDAEMRVVIGGLTVSRQRALVSTLEEDGQEAAGARGLLASLKHTQALRLRDLNCLIQVLAARASREGHQAP